MLLLVLWSVLYARLLKSLIILRYVPKCTLCTMLLLDGYHTTSIACSRVEH